MNRRDAAQIYTTPQSLREYENSVGSLTLTELDNGYDNPDPDAPNPGTTTPTVPTLSVEGVFKGFVLRWDSQPNLTNFERYDVQVSDDNFVTAYDLEFDGSDWKGTVDQLTSWYTELLVHSGLPFGGTAETPTALTLYYRVRRVTKLGVASDWSTVSSATNLLVDTGDLAANSVTTNKVETGFLQALFAAITTLAAGYDGTGSYASPDEGDFSLLIDDARMYLQQYLGGAWSDVNKLSFGVLAGSVLLGMIGCLGIVHPEADLSDFTTEPIPNGNFHLLTFETDYADQNNVAPDFVSSGATRSATWSKFGTYSFAATTGAGGEYLQYDDAIDLAKNLGYNAWVYCPYVGLSGGDITLLFLYYGIDASNYLSISLKYRAEELIAELIEVSGGVTQQTVTITDSILESVFTASPHSIGVVVDFSLNLFTLVYDGSSSSSAISSLTLSGASVTNYAQIFAANLTTPYLIEVYQDNVLFAADDSCNPDLFIKHYLSGNAWSATRNYNDVPIVAGPSGDISLSTDEGHGLTLNAGGRISYSSTDDTIDFEFL